MSAQTRREFLTAVEALALADPRLASLVATHGPPPFWTREPGFAALVLFILEQQVSLASAAAAFGRLEERLGRVSPDRVLGSTTEELRADGISRQKSGYVRALAEAIVEGRIELAGLGVLPDPEVRRALVSLPGIGPWTADVYLLSCLRRPDVWPVGDRALQVGAAETLGLAEVPTAAALETIGETWRPDRSTAARILWHGYLIRRGRV